MTDLATVEQKTTAARITWQEALTLSRDARITNQGDFEFWSEQLRIANRALKDLDDERTFITKPILEGKRRVDAFFAPPLDALKAIDRTLRAELERYLTSERQIREQTMREAAASLETGLTPVQLIEAPPEAEGISSKTVWDFHIVDASLVPRELCSPDPEKIRQAGWYADTPKSPPKQIPGIQWVMRETVRVRK